MTAGMKTTNDGKIKLIAKQPHKIKAALESFVDVSDQINPDPLGLDTAPPWVEKAWWEVVKVVMPHDSLPKDNEMDSEKLGKMLGRLQAFRKMYAGEIAVAPQAEAEFDRFVKFAESQLKSSATEAKKKMLARDLNTRVTAVPQGIVDLTGVVLALSHEDTVKFQKGLSEGMNLSPDDLISANVFERHTRTFWLLASHWHFWMTCKSLGEVHRILCQWVGEDKIGSFKTFENRVAKKIGLTIRGRGRPKGTK